MKIVAFAGLYVLITATLGVALMKESKAIGRWLFPGRLEGEMPVDLRETRLPGVGDEVHASASTTAAGSR